MASSSPSSPPSQLPSNDDLQSSVRELIQKVDLEKTGVSTFIKLLSKEHYNGLDLSPRKKFIKQTLTDAINEQEEEDEEDNDDDSSDEEDDDDESQQHQPKRKKSRGGGGGGLSAKKQISSQLQQFLGVKDSNEMARTEVVKLLWQYIRSHNLQNPNNKREIFLDDAMKQVFGCDVFTMFTMNKYISAHIHPFTPVDLTSSSSSSTPNNKRKRAAKKSPPSSKRKTKKSSSSSPKPSNQPPYRLSPALEMVVGTDILPRPQVVKALWVYIRSHNLQNPNNKKEILCDDKFKKIMGGRSKVTMFNMNSYVGDHLIERVDKSLYTPPPATTTDDDDE